MWQSLLISFALLNVAFHNVSGETDTTVVFPDHQGLVKVNLSEFADAPKKPTTVNMNGQHSYHAAQQIFYFYGLPQWKLQNNNNNVVNKAGSDYLITPGMGAHKLHLRKLTWNRARRTCIQEGGHIAIINSNSEEKLLLRMLEENKVLQAWLGIHDLFEEGDWVTINDEAIETAGYAKWRYPNQPDNAGGKQNCGVLLKDGGMDDVDCTTTNVFFCEIAV